MLEKLKQKVLKANLDLVKYGLVIFTWGNVSGIDRQKGCVVIKPSGVSYKDLKTEDLVVVNLAGKIIEGKLKPSIDTLTHLVLYQAFPSIGGVVHTHSAWATAWAQAGRAIPAYGTTQADYFYGQIPCTRELTSAEIKDNYEQATGQAIVERLAKLKPDNFPGALVKSHGPFSWGADPADAVRRAVIIEECAKLAYLSLMLNSKLRPINQVLLKKHFLRKHGQAAYYGQK